MDMRMRINYNQKELIRLVESHGWRLERQNKHLIYAHPQHTQKIVIPSHKGSMTSGIVRKVVAVLEGKYFGGNHRK